MKKHFDLIVVGSGILGTFHAYHALKSGKSVLILEKDKRPQEATVRNFGQVVPSGLPVGEWNHYGRMATELYKEIQAEYPIGIRNNGSCYIASDESELAVLEELQQKFAADDYESRMLTAGEVIQRYPALNRQYAKGALLFPTEVSAEPEIMIHNLHEYIRIKFAGRVTFAYQSPVISTVATGDEVTVSLATGMSYTGTHCVICNGRDVKLLFPEVFKDSGLEVTRLHMMATRPMPEVALPGNILTGLTIRRYESFKTCAAYQQLSSQDMHPDISSWGIHILFKQRTDGSIIIGDSHEYAAATDQDDLNVFYNEMRINNRMIDEAAKIMDLPDWEMDQYWCGFYMQHKELEIFEQTIDERIHIATGIGGKGMTTSAGYALAHLKRKQII